MVCQVCNLVAGVTFANMLALYGTTSDLNGWFTVLQIACIAGSLFGRMLTVRSHLVGETVKSCKEQDQKALGNYTKATEFLDALEHALERELRPKAHWRSVNLFVALMPFSGFLCHMLLGFLNMLFNDIFSFFFVKICLFGLVFAHASLLLSTFLDRATLAVHQQKHTMCKLACFRHVVHERLDLEDWDDVGMWWELRKCIITESAEKAHITEFASLTLISLVIAYLVAGYVDWARNMQFTVFTVSIAPMVARLVELLLAIVGTSVQLNDALAEESKTLMYLAVEAQLFRQKPVTSGQPVHEALLALHRRISQHDQGKLLGITMTSTFRDSIALLIAGALGLPAVACLDLYLQPVLSSATQANATMFL
eukprot:NODE_687_length_1406_cov_349.780903.p1 GENE.NODE_687_length_1406_cov_349.780903~~NODE_687_length_1406_cov_349.780903.p1  ORF type:complete len:400 (+),score=50.79 NODE_687_length_1406_cov_349.780903:97-1200(+)